MSRTERKELIRRLVFDAGQASVMDLCSRFAVSEATIRRDLVELNAEGVLHRVHGGAIRPDLAAPEPPVVERTHDQPDAKEAIGRAAAELIADGDTVFLGSGSTVLSVARYLRQRRRLTVITNSLPVVNLLASVPDITTIVLGGLLRSSELSMIGHIAEQALAELHADKVVMGIRAVHPEHGLTNDYLPETMTDRAIVALSPQVILVADHTKFGRTAMAYLAPLSALSIVVTDLSVPLDLVQELSQRGIRVVVAGT